MVFQFVKLLRNEFFSFLARPIIDGWYGGFWNFRKTITVNSKIKTIFYYIYLEKNCSFIGINTNVQGAPMCPHGLHGIHVSNGAKIAKGCTIMQDVTIGSNTVKNSKSYGSPTIGENVFIGAGAKIIGNVRIGNGCRIGANCIVVKDVLDNSTVVLGNVRVIIHEEVCDNTYRGICDKE